MGTRPAAHRERGRARQREHGSKERKKLVSCRRQLFQFTLSRSFESDKEGARYPLDCCEFINSPHILQNAFKVTCDVACEGEEG